jgi:hypothetical protein
MIVGTATVEAPTRPKIAAAAAELLQATEDAFERAFAHAVSDGELLAEPPPAARARLAGTALHTLAIRARLGTKPAELRSYAASLLPVICR